MKKITLDRYEALMDAISRYTLEAFDNSVRIGRAPGRGKDPVAFSVGWASIGNVTPAKAAEFVGWLQAASELAAALTELALVVVYDEDPGIPDNAAYHAVCHRFLENLRTCGPASFAVGLESQLDNLIA